MDVEEKVEKLQGSMKLVIEALMAVSESNGCAMDGLLALLPTLGVAGLIEKKEDGTVPFMEALKAQHRQLHNLNTVIATLIKDYQLDGWEEKLSPAPGAPDDTGV